VLRLLGLVNVADGNAAELPQVTPSDVLAWQPDVVFAPNAEFIKAFAARGCRRRSRAVSSPRRARLSNGSTSRHRSIGCSGCSGSAASSIPKSIPKISGRRRGIFYRRFYQVEPSEAQLEQLLASGRLLPR
jgi:hypothetical protein